MSFIKKSFIKMICKFFGWGIDFNEKDMVLKFTAISPKPNYDALESILTKVVASLKESGIYIKDKHFENNNCTLVLTFEKMTVTFSD